MQETLNKMKTKLTLSLKKEVIDGAKIFAKETGRSLSELVENYLESLLQKNSGITKNEFISPKLKRLIGAVELPKDFDENKVKAFFLKKRTM
jgi:hypothetical protein